MSDDLSAGWYDDGEMVDTVRYYDGQAWTDRLAPASFQRTVVQETGPGAMTIARGVALGIVVAVLVLALLGRLFGY